MRLSRALKVCKRAKLNRKQKFWVQSQDLSLSGVPVSETDLKAQLMEAHGLSSGSSSVSAPSSQTIGLAGASAASSSSLPSQGGLGPEVQQAGIDRRMRRRAEQQRPDQHQESRWGLTSAVHSRIANTGESA